MTCASVAKGDEDECLDKSDAESPNCWKYLTSSTHIVSLKELVFNPLQPGVAYLYPLKTLESLKIF